MLETFHQQSQAVQRCESFRAKQPVEAAPLCPRNGCIEKSLRRLRVREALEKIEKGVLRMVVIIVPAVIQHGQTSNRKFAPERQEEGCRGMPVIRVALRIQPEAFVTFQRRYPHRCVLVNPARQVPGKPGPVSDWQGRPNFSWINRRGTTPPCPYTGSFQYSGLFLGCPGSQLGAQGFNPLSTKNSAPRYRKKHSTQAEIQTVIMATCLLCAAARSRLPGWEPTRRRCSRRNINRLRRTAHFRHPLLFGILHHIFKNGWEDKEYIRQRVYRHDEVKKEVMAKWTPDEVTEATGCSEAEVLNIAKTLAENRPGFIIWAMGQTQHTNGNAMVLAA